MAWARKHFPSFEFSVGDTLHVYNYITIGHPEHGRLPKSVAVKVAQEEGDEWVRQNLPTIQHQLDGRPYRIVRWEEWKESAEFERCFKRLSRLYDSNTEFRGLVRFDLTAYLSRQGMDRDDLPTEDQRTLALYVLEELAVYQLQAEARPTVNIYAGGMLRTLKELKTIEGVPASLANRHFAYLEIRDPDN